MWLLSVGDLFADRYRILREIGAGGMSHVFAARDEELEEEVALKIIKPDIAQDENFVARFKREVRIARQIRHPNIVQVLEFGSTMAQDKRLYYLTMELLKGRDMRELLDEKDKLSLADTLRLGHQVCDALGEAHRAGVTHRDIKPQNIFIDDDGQVKLMDFGVSRLSSLPSVTTMGQLIGTPKYMSPEQVHRKETVDRRSDVYSTGILLFELATGETPFDGHSMIQIALKHVDEQPPRPSDIEPELPPEFDKVILTCLEKKPEDRYQTIEDLRRSLQDIPTDSSSHRSSPSSEDTAIIDLATTKRAVVTTPTAVADEAAKRPTPPNVTPAPAGDGLPPTVTKKRERHHTVRNRSTVSTPWWKHRAFPIGAIVILLGLIYFLIPRTQTPVTSLDSTTENSDNGAAPSGPSLAPDLLGDDANDLAPISARDDEPSSGDPAAPSPAPGETTEPQESGASPTPSTIRPTVNPPETTSSEPPSRPTSPQDGGETVPNTTGRVSIRSNPPGANVQIDGRRVGTTPWNGDVAAGRRRITLSADGYTTSLDTLNVEAGESSSRNIELAPVSRNLRVQFSANPGTEVHVDGRLVGTIPPNLETDLATGEHQVLYRMPDYAEHRETIQVRVDADNAFSHRFPLPGPIRVTAQPYARVFLDGKDLGFTPVSLEKVSEGDHQLKLEREGYRTIEETISVTPFEINRFQYTLEEQ